jgi:PAS domain S-box-containing protein
MGDQRKTKQELVAEIQKLRSRLQDAEAAGRDRAESVLEESRGQAAFLANLLENAPQPFGVGFPDGRLGMSNAAFSQLLGYSKAEFAALNWVTDITPTEWREPEAAQLAELQRTGRPVRYEKEYLHRDGSRVPVELLVHLHRDAEGRPAYYYSFITDITARQAAEAEIRRLASFPQLNPNPVLEINASGAITFANQATLAVLQACGEAAGPEAFLPRDLNDILDAARERGEAVFYREVRIKDAFFAENIYYARPLKVIRIYASDITAHKEAEAALQASEGRERIRAAELEAILNAVPTPIFLGHNPDGRFITGNPAAYELLRLPPGSNCSKAAPEDQRPGYKAVQDGRELTLKELPVQRATAGQTVRDFAYDLVFPDGAIRHITANAVPLLDGDGRPRGAVAAFMDLTARRQAEDALQQAHDKLEQRVQEQTADLRRTVEQLQLEMEERLAAEERLRQSEARFRSAFDQSPVGAVIVDQDLGFQRVNPAYCQITGYTAEELTSMKVADISHPDDLPNNLEAARRFLAGEMVHSRLQERNIRKDGAVIWVDISASVINPGDRPSYFLGIVQDITARKAAEEALAQHTALVQDLYNQAPCGYHSLDAAGRFVQINDTALNWLGYTRDEVVGRMSFTDLLTTEGMALFQQNFSGFVKRGWVRDLEFDLVRRDGTLLPVALSATAITDAAGNYVMSRSTVFDITERRRAAAALEAERRRFFTMLEKIPAYVALIAPDCTIPFANHEFIRRFGDPGKRLCYEFLFGLDAPCEGCRALEVFKTSTAQIWEWTGPDGCNYQIHDHPFTDADGSPLVLEMGVDISGLKAAEAGILKQSAVLSGINRVFRESLTCATEAELGRTCLAVAEELTGSAFGFIGEVNQTGGLDISAFSDPGWAACRMGAPGKERLKLPGPELGGLLGRVVAGGRPVITNDPANHPAVAGLPPGHPPLATFLGVPLRHGGRVIGLIAMANKAGGYIQADQEALESLGGAIVEGLMRFRAETRVAIVSRLYLLLSKVNEAIVRAQDQTALFQQICRIAVVEGRFKMAWVGMIEGPGDAVKAVAQYGLEEGYLERIRVSFREGPESCGPTGTAVREDRSDICNDIANDPRMAPWRDEALQRGYRSSGSFPLRVDSQVVGSLTMYAGEPNLFTGEEVSLLESLAHDVSFAMESMQRDAQRRQAEAALKASEERLRDLTTRLLNAQEAERKRLAIELHDDLGQSLMVLRMQVREIEKMLPVDQWQTREFCGQVLDYINEVVENVRRLSRDLMPSILEDLGLVMAIKHILEHFCKYHEMELAWDPDDIQGLLSSEQEILIYRIFQESLTNIAKHAYANLVTVVIQKSEGAIHFGIEDNGVGFDLQNLATRNRRDSGLGLASMEERARMLNGTLEIWSQEGQGTRITFVVPVRHAEI